MGNWELAGIALANFGVPLFVIMRSQKNPLIDAYLNKTREATAIDAVKMGSRTIAGVVEKLKEGRVLAILPDIRAKRNPVVVDFLGGRADIARGMAFFARSAGVPILPVHIWREGWCKHHWILSSDAVYPDNNMNRDADVERMTKLVMSHFDEIIRKHPDQYFWFNKKWILGDDA
jgi:KDO2-lipid IV(A) lauroyltransferase